MPLPPEDRAPSAGPVLLYDGDCELCCSLVRWLRARHGGERLGYLALQAPAAQRYLADNNLPTRDFDSVVFVPEWAGANRKGHLLRTDGLFAALRVAGGWLRLVSYLRYLPRPIRDGIYALVARFRHRLATRQA